MTETQRAKKELPLIPDKRYFSIGEAANLCAVKPHVLRYWEQEFSQLKPNKRLGNRRYYQEKDLLLIRKIRELLYEEGYTIDGARQAIMGKKTQILAAEASKNHLREAIHELEQVFSSLNFSE